MRLLPFDDIGEKTGKKSTESTDNAASRASVIPIGSETTGVEKSGAESSGAESSSVSKNDQLEGNAEIVRQIEVKAYLDSYQLSRDRIAGLADAGSVDRVQQDIFFHCRSGRLKLRNSGQFHDLIYYRRDDDYGPTQSFYQFARTKNPMALRTSLNSAFGEVGRVKKFRQSYKIGRSTIHLDRVCGLGDFLEIKTELNPASFSRSPHFSESQSISVQQGTAIVESLMATLDIDLFQLIDGAYIDLINERKAISC